MATLTLFILITILKDVLPKAIETSGYETTTCNIRPENSTLPCIQYNVNHAQYCNEGQLQKLFPHLYKIDDEIEMTWPGPIHNASVVENQSNITWTGPRDGSIKYLKGYQIIEMGFDFNTFRIKLCTIFDLSGISKEDYNLLKDTTFVVHNSQLGTMLVTVKPLPVGPIIPAHTQTVSSDPIEYYPKLQFFVDYHQISDNLVNISLHVEPQVDGLEYFTVLVENPVEFKRLGDMEIPVNQTHFVVGNLTAGNYSLKISPKDDSEFGQVGNCICYEGSSGGRKRCVACRPYRKLFQVVNNIYDITTTSADLSDSHPGPGLPITAVVVPILVILLSAGGTASICIFMRKRALTHWCLTARRQDITQFDDMSKNGQRIRIHVVYACDHNAHARTVKTLVDLLEQVLDCTVSMSSSSTCSDYGPSQESISSRQTHTGDNDDKNCADLLCFVNSEWAYKLINATRTVEISNSDIANKSDSRFLEQFDELTSNSDLKAKVVSLKFEYTSDSHIIRQPFLGPLFNIPTNIDALVKHMQHRLDIHLDKEMNIHSDKRVALVTSMNSAFAYQTKNKHWLATKTFYMRNAPASDDSGVVIPRRDKSRSKSIRSRSADTISCYTCHSSSVSSRSHCVCHNKPVSRQRANSLNLSFYPPDTDDDVSLGYSLLATKLLDVNDRYAYVTNNKLSIDDDCLTVDGNSV